MNVSPVLFLEKSLEFLKKNWSEGKYTQRAVALKLGVTNSYISKARSGNIGFAEKLRPKLLKIIEDVGGKYIENENAFLDKNGKLYDASIPTNSYRLDRVSWGKLIRMLRGGDTLKLLTTWIDIYSDAVKYFKIDKNKELLRGKKVQLLLLHPYNYSTLLRSQALGANVESGYNRIVDDLHNLYELFKDFDDKKNVSIRLYSSLPTVNLLITQSSIISGFYLNQQHLRDLDQLIIEKNKDFDFAKKLEQHFNDTWEQSGNTIKIDDIPSVLDNLEPPPYKRFNNSVYKKYIGIYKLYYAERYSTNDFRGHKMSNSIGCNILEIYQEKTSGIFKCKMKYPGVDNSEDFYTGELINTHFNSKNYIILYLINKTLTRRLNIYLYIKDRKSKDRLFGLFTVVYRTSQKIGSGNLFLNKVTGEEYEKIDPTSLAPTQIEKHEHLEPYLIRYLINRKESLILSASSESEIKKEEEIEKIKEIEGLYYVYAWSGEGGEVPQITQGVLDIHYSGVVTYKNKINGYSGAGWLRVDNEKKNFYIEVRNSNPEVKRTALFVIDGLFDKKNGKKYYNGVCASSTWHDGIPVGSRVIMEEVISKDINQKLTFEKVKPQKIKVGSKEYRKFPLDVKQKLSGIVTNMVGFFEGDRAVDVNETFFKAAGFDATKGDAESFLQNLKSAVYHGFNDVKQLQSLVSLFPDKKVTEKTEFKNEIENIKQIITDMNSV